MLEFRFLVATEDMPGLPGLERGDAVVRAAVEIADGGYEYDVWHKIGDGTTAKTRISHREGFEEFTVEGETRAELLELVAQRSSEVASGRR